MENFILVGAAFALGGILKGATGAGAPIVAVPLLAILYDVPLAVTVFVIPNLVPNMWQAWVFRKHQLPLRFALGFSISGALGAAVGTYLLSNLPADVLSLLVAFAVLIYVGFRMLHPNWILSFKRAITLVFPVGFMAGILQGSSGVSAPASITFLNAMRLERPQFIAIISVFFVAIALVQVPLLAVYGFLTQERLILSCLALIPLVAFMPVGAFLVRHISKKSFDFLILVLLLILAIKLIVDVVLKANLFN